MNEQGKIHNEKLEKTSKTKENNNYKQEHNKQAKKLIPSNQVKQYSKRCMHSIAHPLPLHPLSFKKKKKRAAKVI